MPLGNFREAAVISELFFWRPSPKVWAFCNHTHGITPFSPWEIFCPWEHLFRHGQIIEKVHEVHESIYSVMDKKSLDSTYHGQNVFHGLSWKTEKPSWNFHGLFHGTFMELVRKSWNFLGLFWAHFFMDFMDFFMDFMDFFETCGVMDFFLEQENVQNFSQKERRKLPNTFDRTPSFS